MFLSWKVWPCTSHSSTEREMITRLRPCKSSVWYALPLYCVKHGKSGRLCKFDAIYSLQMSVEISDAAKLLVAGVNLYCAIINYVIGCKL